MNLNNEIALWILSWYFLKLIKIYPWSVKIQKHAVTLAILSIEKENNPAVNYSDKFTMPLLLKVIKLVRLYCLINSYILFWMVCCGSFISGRSVVSSMDPGTCMCACAHTHTKTLLGDEEGGKDTVQQSEAIQLATALYTEHVLAICNCIQISLSHVKWYTLSSECTLFVTHTIGKLDILLQEYFYINWCQAWNLLQCVYGK